MDYPIVYLERRYRLNISEDFLHRFKPLFPVLVSSRESIKGGVYYWEIKVKEERGKYIWESKVLDKYFVPLTNRREVFSLRFYIKSLAFIAEIVNYTHDYDLCYWDESYFDLRSSDIAYFTVKNFEIGDTFADANFEIEMEFDNDSFYICEKTFEKMGIDTNKYNIYSLYKWVISKTSAKLYYYRECVYTHPNPMLLLAYLGWYIAAEAL